MMQILDNIEYHNNIEGMELLLNYLIKFDEEDYAILIHAKYLKLQLNPKSNILSIVFKKT